jgi:hypothetical protein
MFKKEIRNHLPITLIWLALVTLLRWHWHWNLILLWLGGVVGTFLIDLDHLLYVLFIYPSEEASKRVRQLVNQRFYKEALLLLINTRGERTKLAFHNALFQPVLYLLCFFVLTSTGSLLGTGLVMAMALRLLKDEIVLLLRGKEEELRRWLFWQVPTEVTLRQQKFFVIIMLLIFLGLNLLLV